MKMIATIAASMSFMFAVYGCAIENGPDPDDDAEEAVAESQQAINCVNAVASATISVVSASGGVMSASGTCSWSGGDVNGVRLTYYLNGAYVSQGDYDCSSGWQFSTSVGIDACAINVLEVRAVPRKYTAPNNELCSQTSKVSKSFAELSCDKCYIGGKWYNNGALNPSSACSWCDTSISKVSWSYNPNGYSNTNGYCNFSGVSGGPDYGVCSTDSPKVGTPCEEASDCWISCGAE